MNKPLQRFCQWWCSQERQNPLSIIAFIYSTARRSVVQIYRQLPFSPLPMHVTLINEM